MIPVHVIVTVVVYYVTVSCLKAGAVPVGEVSEGLSGITVGVWGGYKSMLRCGWVGCLSVNTSN